MEEKQGCEVGEGEKINEDDKLFCVPSLPAIVTMPPPPPPPQQPSSSTADVVSSQQQTKKSMPQQPPPPLNYEKPAWSVQPPLAQGESELDQEGFCDHYYLEVIKNGTLIEKIKLEKEYLTFGRLDVCDIPAEHPTLSRYHALLQYSNGLVETNYQQGFFLYDLGSTHGTFLNKTRLQPRQYTLVNLESIIKFGQSTRLYILHGPKAKFSSEDLKINLTHEQMKKIKEKHAQISLKLKIRKEVEEEERREKMKQEEASASWGFDNEDANCERKANKQDGNDNADDDGENYFGKEVGEVDESFFTDDPRKALKNYFDREGRELAYDFEELGVGKYKCTISLPITNNYGEPIYAEAQHEGKKKECMTLCALEACRILNAEGCLKSSRKDNARKRREKDWESGDYYDSDEDTYFDRTGDVEKKRLQRMSQAGKLESAGGARKMLTMQKNVTITFEMILSDMKTILLEQWEIDSKLERCKEVFKAVADDDVDAYINSLKANENAVDTLTRAKMKKRLVEIKNELARLEKLLKVAKPHDFKLDEWKESLLKTTNGNSSKLPPLKQNDVSDVETSSTIKFSIPRQVDEAKAESAKSEMHKEQGKVESESKASPSTENLASKTKLLVKSDEPIESPKPKRPKPIQQQHQEEKEDVKSYDDLVMDMPLEYATWQPPEGQSGDGKTKLNEKFGY